MLLVEKKNYYSHLNQYGILYLVLIIFVIFKFQHLGYPYIWDESSSYMPAITKMIENGPGLLPGVIPMTYSKGHPLLFYFIFSSWITVFSNKIFAVRILALLISCCTLVCFHKMTRRYTNNIIANISLVLLSMQSLFLAQASLILPEMLLTLLVIITFEKFISKKYILFAIFGSLMVLTKETAVVFIACFLLFYFFENLKTIHAVNFWKEISLISVPLAVYILFLVFHYAEFDTFFYEGHINFIDYNLENIFRKFNSAAANIFTRYGRNIILAASILSVAILLFRKKKFRFTKVLLLSFLLAITYLIFSSFNFYTHRYLLAILPFFIFAASVIIYQARFKNKFLNIFLMILVVVPSLYKSLNETDGGGDYDLGYTQYIHVHKEAVAFCEENDWYDKQICCGTNLVMALNNKIPGYLSTEHTFGATRFPVTDSTEIVIIDSTGPNKELSKNSKREFVFSKHFEYKKHWSNIYIRKKSNALCRIMHLANHPGIQANE